MEGKKKILLVDDDENLLDTYAAVFREAGFEVVSTWNGRAALDIITGIANDAELPHLVFTGISMPEMTGFELIEAMRREPRFAKIPIAISSHRGLPEDEARAKTIGAKDFIVQGLTPPAEVLRRIRMILGGEATYRVSVATSRGDGGALVELLRKQLETSCLAVFPAEAELEVRATEERGVFRVKLICKQ